MSKIYGIALTKDGEPVGDVNVELVASDGAVSQTIKTGEDGIFEFEVDAGSWGLKWTPRDGQPTESNVDVVQDEDAEVELEIP